MSTATLSSLVDLTSQSPRRSRNTGGAAALAFCPTGLLIDGAFASASSGRVLPVEDPATGRVVFEVADADPQDCARALDAAVQAQRAWAATAPRERARVLRRASDRLRDLAATFATLVTVEMGKPLAESRAEVEFAADYLEWFAEESVRIEGRVTLAPDGESQLTVVHVPVGPCLVITPWNFPLAVAARGVGPALAAGCTVVLRPSALTPLSALALGRVLVEAGLPAGVLNIVVSSLDEATDPLLREPGLRKVTFTGSQAVGRHLVRQSAERTLRVSVELGGCAPFVVFDDACLDDAVEGAVAAKMRNGGAACTAANRFFVHESIAEEFTHRLAARLAGVRIGCGTRTGVGLGPMISARHVARLAELVDDAVARGARVVLRGGPVPGDGHFFAPVVLDNVPPEARVMEEEIFGPVVAISSFRTEDEAIARANASEAGLAAYLYTQDVARVTRLAGAIEAGMLAVNRGRVSCVSTPFGGVKQSGYGTSGGTEGIHEYLTTRCITLPTRPAGMPASPPPDLMLRSI